jgi:hypothetical protein
MPRTRAAEPRVESFNTSDVDRVDATAYSEATPTTEHHSVPTLTESFDSVSEDFDLPEFLKS